MHAGMVECQKRDPRMDKDLISCNILKTKQPFPFLFVPKFKFVDLSVKGICFLMSSSFIFEPLCLSPELSVLVSS